MENGGRCEVLQGVSVVTFGSLAFLCVCIPDEQ